MTYRLNLQAARSRAESLLTSHREYIAQRGGRISSPTGEGQRQQGLTSTEPSPQVSDSLVDRLLELSAAAQSDEADYRRGLTEKYVEASNDIAAAQREVGYYENLLKQASTPPPMPGGPLRNEPIDQRFHRVLKALTDSVDRIQRLFHVISTQTLNPSRQMYSVTQPFMLQKTAAIPFRVLAIGFVLTIVLTLVGAAMGSLIHAHRRMPSQAGRDEARQKLAV
jgi:hypothetical protein